MTTGFFAQEMIISSWKLPFQSHNEINLKIKFRLVAIFFKIHVLKSVWSCESRKSNLAFSRMNQ